MNLAEFIIMLESYNANIDIPFIRKAYEFSDRAHEGQKRSSGEPFIEHCLEVAIILAELHMDSTTLAAGLIHDVVEDTTYSLEDVRREFGDEVADLVDGVTKLSAVHFNSREEQQVEYFRKMLLSMAKDVRVILIKLADRLHNMRTLEHLPPEKWDGPPFKGDNNGWKSEGYRSLNGPTWVGEALAARLRELPGHVVAYSEDVDHAFVGIQEAA